MQASFEGCEPVQSGSVAARSVAPSRETPDDAEQANLGQSNTVSCGGRGWGRCYLRDTVQHSGSQSWLRRRDGMSPPVCHAKDSSKVHCDVGAVFQLHFAAAEVVVYKRAQGLADLSCRLLEQTISNGSLMCRNRHVFLTGLQRTHEQIRLANLATA